MSIQNFIPNIWSALVLEVLRNTQDITGIFNRDYQGDAAMGDLIKVQTYGGTTIRDYNTTGADIVIDPVTSSTADILINKNKYSAKELNDVDAIQANLDLNAPIIQDMAGGFQEQLTTDILSDCVTGVATANIIDSGATGALDDFLEARRRLTNGKVPLGNRWAIIHPDFEKDVLGIANIVNADQYGGRTPLATGEIGQIFGFRVVVSPFVQSDGSTATAKYQNVFMHESACAYVTGRDFFFEALRMEKRIADELRANMIYGTKLIRAAAMVIVKTNV